MVVRDSTHQMTALSIDYNVAGRRLPLLQSSSGLAYLAFAPPVERRLLLERLAQSDAPQDVVARNTEQTARLVTATRRRGYGVRQGGAIWPHTGSLALPVRHDKRVLGCITVIWMAKVSTVTEGIARCLASMRKAQATIEARLLEEI
jgi:IclR family mhp operon transcriptional activator